MAGVVIHGWSARQQQFQALRCVWINTTQLNMENLPAVPIGCLSKLNQSIQLIKWGLNLEDFLLFTAPVKNVGPEGGAKMPQLRLEFGLTVLDPHRAKWEKQWSLSETWAIPPPPPCVLEQGLAHFFCKKPGSKYFQLCTQVASCLNSSTLQS